MQIFAKKIYTELVIVGFFVAEFMPSTGSGQALILPKNSSK